MQNGLYSRLFLQNSSPADSTYVARLDNKCFEVGLEAEEIRELDTMGAVIRMCSLEGHIVGYWIGVYSQRVGHKERHLIVSKLGVHPDYRRRGIAARLIEDMRYYSEGKQVGLLIPEYCLTPG